MGFIHGAYWQSEYSEEMEFDFFHKGTKVSVAFSIFF